MEETVVRPGNDGRSSGTAVAVAPASCYSSRRFAALRGRRLEQDSRGGHDTCKNDRLSQKMLQSLSKGNEIAGWNCCINAGFVPLRLLLS